MDRGLVFIENIDLYVDFFWEVREYVFGVDVDFVFFVMFIEDEFEEI